VPRIARVVAVGAPHHVIRRGNNRQKTLFSDADRRVYLAVLGAHCRHRGVELLGSCLMANHVHMAAVPRAANALAKALGRTHQDYAAYLNRRRGWGGHLWQYRFHSTVMDTAHIMAALRYVDLNPLRAGRVPAATE
jgi:putative transposase